MNLEDFLHHFEKIVELPPNSVEADMLLSEIEQWDSMAILQLIALFETEVHQEIDIFDLSSTKTVRELYNLIR